MSAAPPATEQNDADNAHPALDQAPAGNDAEQGDDGGDTEEEEEEEEDEPKLKYAKLTGSLTNVYRGDSTSAFLVSGDKAILGTHNGNVHILQLPGLQPLKTYHAHSATITSISVSPVLPPPKPQRATEERGATSFSPPASVRSQQALSTPGQRNARNAQPQVSNTPNNQIYIATSSLDGHVCINSLLDPKDVQLRNFARPVSAVALSPDYKNDRTYLSGGLAGQLILTVGGKAGVTIDANTNSAAAAASGWFGSIGLGGDRGKDTMLHSGEGSISAIKWSRTGKWVVWVNEEGIKIMRSHLKLGSENGEDAWRRIAHAAKPNKKIWKEMAGVWKGRCEWSDERNVEADEDLNGIDAAKAANGMNGNGIAETPKRTKRTEKLLVGWGDCAWLLEVQEGGVNAAGKKQIGSADIPHKLQFHDCVISGIAQFTPSMVAILAYRTRDDDDKPVPQPNDTPKKGRQHRHTGLAPHLRLVKIASGEEVDLDELSISRFESLSAQDYHLGSLWVPPPPPSLSNPKTLTDSSRGALEGIWDAAGGKYASRMFSSSASVMSRSSSGKDGTLTSPPASVRGVPPITGKVSEAHPFVDQAGLKLWVVSPYDCVLAIKRDESDRLEWLLGRQMYQQAWELVDLRPGVVDTSTTEQKGVVSSPPSTPSRAGPRQDASLADFFADDSRSASTAGPQAHNSIAQKEKRRIADLWLQQLVNAEKWEEAGKVAGKVLNTGSRWEHWVLAFAQRGKFDEITPFIPAARQDDDALGGGMRLPSLVYEVVLGHYISTDPLMVGQLLEKWDPDAFDASSVISAIESRLEGDELRQDSGDWRVLMEALGRLYLSDGRAQDALRCWIRTQNADKAMELIREEKLVDVIANDNVAGLLMLRITKQMLRDAPIEELDAASSEVISLLVGEALRGTVMPAAVIDQLSERGKPFRLFAFFYMRALWNASSTAASAPAPTARRGKFHRGRLEAEGHALVEDHADLALDLFATYDRDILMTFLRASTVYSYDKAAAICEQRHYIPELVYILSKTGQTKRALFLIIGELGDVRQAIEFAKENPDLWDDLLEYGMDKPSFIKGLLEEVGTAIDPIELVRRIPEGLEIEGLKEAVRRMLRAYDVQVSLSEGAAKVLRGEVVGGMDTLRAGRRKGVRFEVLHETQADVDLAVVDPPTKVDGGDAMPVARKQAEKHETRQKRIKPGHCVACGEVFHEEETEPLLGFACGHVYHLACLLRSGANPTPDLQIERVMAQMGYRNRGGGGDEADAYTGRSVGGKVAHAHVIKGVVGEGGCRHCAVAE